MGDTLARLGGDEFVILMEGVRDMAEVTRLAERLCTSPTLWAPYALEGREVIVRASIGVTMGRAGEIDAGNLLRDADTALYRAKATGKSYYAVFDPAMNTAAIESFGAGKRAAPGHRARRAHGGVSAAGLSG